jgi:glutamine amidotransferase
VKRVALIDYGAGNLGSMRRALEECGAHAVPTADPAVVLSADAVVLPGVGAFQNAMRRLGALGLIEAVTRKVVERQAPFLGVCLGMQLLAGYGFEPEKTRAWAGSRGSWTGFRPARRRRTHPPRGLERGAFQAGRAPVPGA